MGEIKSVKVDNWGVFFLQKLQNFFNKTDYCDLTLQFNDNSQLKVHRLVLSACTDYFNVLEQTCDVVDDALIMPNELQADVVVPIVNFMYTGTLEFELKMYGKLLRTAKEMNMTVLLKLLEAHRRTMEGVNRSQRPASPKNIRRRGPMPAAPTSVHFQPRPSTNPLQQQQPRRVLSTTNAMAQQRQMVQTKTIATSAAQVQQYRQQPASLLKTSAATNTLPQKSQRFSSEASGYVGSESTYGSTMQFKEEQQDDYDIPLNTMNQSTSPFEQLRKGYNNNKRPASTSFVSPPAKKPNIEDVKEFAEQQRMRKQIAAEYGEDQDYEGNMLDDDIHNDDDDDDTGAVNSSAAPITATRQQQHQPGPSIIIKQEPNEKPTIVVKDSLNSKMNHAKIISEVLRQYPHLVKSNKNIKLKIMPNVGGQSQKIIVKKEQIDNISSEMNAKTGLATSASNQSVLKSVETSQQQTRPTQKVTLSQPATASATGNASQIAATTAASATVQKRRIDSKTMHALIALGAENTTGPWLCLRCGVNGRPISIPSYRGFRRHLINTHKETIDPALCEHCGRRSTSNRELHFHIQVDHKIKTSLYTFPECLMCAELFLDTNALNQHMVDSHPDENQQQCIYCNKIFAKEIQLYTHVKTYHKRQAIDDGIIDYSEDDDDDDDDGDAPMDAQDDCVNEKQESLSSSNNVKGKKIKILSDISLPSTGSLMKLEPSTEETAAAKIASGIAANIDEEFISTRHETAQPPATVGTVNEPKFVTADGNEMVLTDEQRKEIISQLNQEHEGGVVMVLNESVFADTEAAAVVATNEDAASVDESAEPSESAVQTVDEEEEDEQSVAAVSADEDEEYDDNINYEFSRKSEAENKKEASVLDESKGSTDNLEWAENLVTAHELEEEQSTSKIESEPTEKKEAVKTDDDVKDRKKVEDINKKLKELTCDWSDDEIDEDEDEMLKSEDFAIPKEFKNKEDIQGTPEKVEKMLEDQVLEEMEGSKKVEIIKEEKFDTPEKCETECKQDEVEPEDDIDIALKSLHRDDESDGPEVGNAADRTRCGGESSSNPETNDDNNCTQSEYREDVKKIDISSENESEFIAIEKLTRVANEISPVTSVGEVTDELEGKKFDYDIKEEKEEQITQDDTVDGCKAAVEEPKPGDDDAKQNVTQTKAADSNVIPEGTNQDEIAEEPDAPIETVGYISTVSKTEEKIKTLISDWGEDDDEDNVEDIGTLD